MSAGYSIDLHTHSRRSDGVHEPEHLVELAAERGVRTLALADHDTLAGAEAAAAAGERCGVRVIPAVELNTESDWGDAHVLGYFLDPADGALEDRLRFLREHRAHRIEKMVANLTALGHAVALGRVLEIAGGGALGRPHLAQALYEAGHVPSYDAAFQTLIAKDAPGYVARTGLTPLEAVQLVRAHGGVPSLAHPATVSMLDALVERLVDAGLAGIECYYGSHTPAWTAHCLALADRHGVVPTGGSDFHGRGDHGAPLGAVFVPPETIAMLEAAIVRR